MKLGEYFGRQEWIAATLKDSLAGDRIRIGTEETDVLRSTVGQWHAGGDSWHPVRWDHQELWLELSANPPYQQYGKPDTEIEILCTPERAAVLLLQQEFNATPVDK